jgi:hypothetical protein
VQSERSFFVVTNEQLYFAIGIPMLFNTVLIGLVLAVMNAKFAALEAKFGARFVGIEARLDAIDKRFDDMRDLWRAELHRVEEVLDARLKHLESR